MTTPCLCRRCLARHGFRVVNGEIRIFPAWVEVLLILSPVILIAVGIGAYALLDYLFADALAVLP
jgi:uncharacterized membrane protein YhdT